MTSPVATVGVYVNAGSRDGAEGAAAVYASAALAGQAAAVAAVGGQVRAVASREGVEFVATVLPEHVPAAAAALAAMVGAAPSEAAVAAAKDAVQAEIAGAFEDPGSALLDHLHDAAYLDQAMGAPTTGSKEAIEALSGADVAAFVSSHVSAPNVVVSAAGAVEHEAVAKAFDGSAVAKLAESTDAMDHYDAPATFIGSDKRIRYDSFPMARVAFAFETVPAHSEHVVPLMLLEAVVGAFDISSGVNGKNLASKTAIDLCEEEMVHSYAPISAHYKDSGFFGMTFTATDVNLEGGAWNILENLMR